MIVSQLFLLLFCLLIVQFHVKIFGRYQNRLQQEAVRPEEIKDVQTKEEKKQLRNKNDSFVRSQAREKLLLCLVEGTGNFIHGLSATRSLNAMLGLLSLKQTWLLTLVVHFISTFIFNVN